MRLYVGDDWAEDHHDIEVMNESGKVLAKRRLPEGVAGIAQLHELIGRYPGEDDVDAEVVVGIKTRPPAVRVAALVAAGYAVFPVNPLQASRYRKRQGVSGAKSDGGDAHLLADMVRTDSRRLHPAAAFFPLRRRASRWWPGCAEDDDLGTYPRGCGGYEHQLREYFQAALAAFEDLDAPDALELLGRAPDPSRAAKLTRAQISSGAQARPPPCHIAGQATAILAALRGEQLGQRAGPDRRLFRRCPTP